MRPARRARRCDELAQLTDARVAGEGQSAALDELHARVVRWIVGGRAHQAAVELARADGPVEHLRSDHPDVEYVGALVRQAADVLPGHRGGGQAHVASHTDPQIRHTDVLQVAQHTREGAPDAVRERLVHLVGVYAPHVVRLEDRLVHHGSGRVAHGRLG